MILSLPKYKRQTTCAQTCLRATEYVLKAFAKAAPSDMHGYLGRKRRNRWADAL